jgi:glycosyltransferase involved in cell wall biosynthesis
VRRLAGQLAAGGWGATVVTRRSLPELPVRERLDGVEVVRVQPSGPARRGKYLMVPWAMAALARETVRYDVLVVRGTRVLGPPGLLAGRWRGVPVVMQPEINGELSGQAYTWGTRLERAPWRQAISAAVSARNGMLRDADAFVAMSRAIEAEMLAAGIARDKVVLLPHGIDLQHFRPAPPAEKDDLRARLHVPGAARVVVWTGRLLKGKGLETLLDAFALVAAADPDAQLVLVGSGEGQALSVEAELRDRAGRGPLAGRVIFAGRVDNVTPWLKAADVFAFPSEYEALGLSLIEAAACGLPCVGARTGGIVDVIQDGVTGLFFEPRDTAGLAAALQRLLADPALCAQLGARGRLDVESRFDDTASAERYRTLFRELMARGRPAPPR